ncbi:hypothetical protein D3C71_1753250 [compost metagenome]
MIFCICIGVAVDVGMARNQFITDCIEYVYDVEMSVFFGNAGIEYKMHQDVTKFFFDFWIIFFQNGVG